MKPHTFTATSKPFTVKLGIQCLVTGYTVPGDRGASFYRPIPVKKGDTFKSAPGKGIILNGKLVERKARKLKKMVYRVSWVASRLRVVAFKTRARLWDRKKGRPTKKFGKPYWVAYDVRSYCIGTDALLQKAINNLLIHCQYTNLMAAEFRAKGHRVIRWRCLLTKAEIKKFEKLARKDGFILEGVEVPPFPKKWVDALKKLKAKSR